MWKMDWRFSTGLLMVRSMLIGVLLITGVTACSLFSEKETPPVEPNVLPPNYRSYLIEFLKGHLTDPMGVKDAYITEPRLQPIGADSRYVVCVRFNSKDGYGEYAGIRDFIAIYFNGKLTQFVRATPDQCANALYQRFPELEQLKK